MQLHVELDGSYINPFVESHTTQVTGVTVTSKPVFGGHFYTQHSVTGSYTCWN